MTEYTNLVKSLAEKQEQESKDATKLYFPIPNGYLESLIKLVDEETMVTCEKIISDKLEQFVWTFKFRSEHD